MNVLIGMVSPRHPEELGAEFDVLVLPIGNTKAPNGEVTQQLRTIKSTWITTLELQRNLRRTAGKVLVSFRRIPNADAALRLVASLFQ